MKKLQLVFFLLIGIAGVTSAQQKGKLTAVIKTPTVQCQECKDRIERYMSHEEGIVKCVVDFKKKNGDSNLPDRPDQYREHQGPDRQRGL